MMCSPMDTSASIRQMMAEETARQTPRRETCAERAARLNRRAPTIQAILDHPTIDPTVVNPEVRLAASDAFWAAMSRDVGRTSFYPPRPLVAGPAADWERIYGADGRRPNTPPRDAVVRDQGFGGTRKFYASEAV